MTSGTTIQLREEKKGAERKARVAYEDIGGLQKAIQRVREMIELPLKYPQIFERLGIDPPKGVLLHGPPGTGKTLIARVVASETDAHFVHLSGPEVMGKFYGESEKRLRDVFEEASAHAPSIIFLDELDAIAPKREEMGGEKQVERRVVAQLLALMDGLESRGQVIVIGATNIPNVLDPALRRPGRFDREIEIGIPDRNGRFDILQIHTRGMPLADDVDVEKLAEITHGFVGADLEALAREAAMTALRRIFPVISSDLEEIPYETILTLEVTMTDFLDALKEVEPSAIREVFVEVPDVRWSQVGGLDDVKQRLVEAVEWPLKYAKLFAQARTKAPKGILLHGAPGTGKTLLAKAVATETAVNFIAVKGPALLSKYVGESERAVRELFKKARQAAPCILFLDELDAMAPTRSGLGGDAHVTERVISQLLTELDGIEELRGVMVLGATNRIDMIDPALLRPGRFDLLLEVPVPDRQARRQIFEVHTAGKPLGPDVDVERLAEQTEGAVGADLEGICQEASLHAIREVVEHSANDEAADMPLTITMGHFEKALAEWAARARLG
jgi:transitional endoplasmic reticulum ATPase